MEKKEKYEVFIDRLESHLNQGNYLESAWYSYAVLEDRCKSLLLLSDDTANNEIRMLGSKVEELKNRKDRNNYLKGVLLLEKDKPDLLQLLHDWKEERNILMHSMGNDDSLSINDIDRKSKKLASEGKGLVRQFCSACRSLKKYKKKKNDFA